MTRFVKGMQIIVKGRVVEPGLILMHPHKLQLDVAHGIHKIVNNLKTLGATKHSQIAILVLALGLVKRWVNVGKW